MLRILQGDALEQLPRLPAQSVQCCITSPPYWGLRDYGTGQWEGGNIDCDHYPPRCQGETGQRADRTFTAVVPYRELCGKCGARRIDSQLGLESTPQEYIANMVAVFREVWRVLRDDGTLWLNLGDSYAGKLGERGDVNGTSPGRAHVWDKVERPTAKQIGLKPKDLCMMPARLALALQSDGWYLRSDIIWHKPNPMPESVTDRPTKAHEYIFLLTKAERYYYDSDAIREPQVDFERGDNVGNENGGHRKNGYEREDLIIRWKPNNESKRQYNPAGRNKRTVWTIATQPYSEAHFATFPEEIPKLAILAGSKPSDTILDPFAGAGTVGKVALELGRRAVLIELNPEYVRLIEDRTRVTPGMF